MAAAGGSATSKSFRAILPGLAQGGRPGGLTADDEARLRHYCAENFSASAVFVDSREERTDCAPVGGTEIVWLATRDRTRAVTSHRRSARAVLAKLRIPTTGLKGTWLVLAADEAVRAAAAEQRAARQMQPRCQAQSAIESGEPHGTSSNVADDSAALRSTRAPREAAAAQAVASCSAQDVTEDAGVKVIELGGGSCRGGAAKSFSFEVLR